MSCNLVPHEPFTLQQLALHETAKKVWNDLVFQDPAEISKLISLIDNDRPWSLKLYEHKVRNAFPPALAKVLKEKLFQAMIDIKLGFNAAGAWRWQAAYFYELVLISPEIRVKGNSEQVYQNFLYSTPRPNSDKYETIRFIKPLGRFDDLSWAKIFVADEMQPLKSRFYLASMYCFEEEIQSLWSTMTVNNQILCDSDMRSLDYNNESLVKLWISRLQGETGDSFFVDGWKWAYNGCHEHAAAYFFRHCSKYEKAKILADLSFDHIFDAADYICVGFVRFIYTLLSVEMKCNLISYSNQYREGTYIFITILCSPYYESILNDFLLYLHSVPSRFIKRIVNCLMRYIAERPIPRYKEILKVVWNHLSMEERTDVLGSSNLLLNLTSVNDLDLFELCLLPLPRSTKEQMLLNTKEFSISFFCRENFEGLFRYLLFLLLDYDGEKLELRSDAETVLDILMNPFESCYNYHNFITMTKYLKEILPIVDKLVKGKDHSTTTHDFLARKIYPMSSVISKL